MRIIHVIAGLQKAAGTTAFAENAVAGLRERGHEVEICTKFADLVRGKRPDVVHIHGVWPLLLHRASRWARKNGIPVVWSTHGMTAPWSMRHKWLKKIVAWSVYQRRDLKQAAAIHCTTDLEVDWNKALGLKNPFIVVPLGTQVESCKVEKFQSFKVEKFQSFKVSRCQGGKVERFQGGKVERFQSGEVEKFQGEGERAEFVVLFVGRVHPVKGLMNLVRAAGTINRTIEQSEQSNNRKILFRIVGPDQDGHTAELKAQCDRLGLTYSDGENSTVHLHPSPSPQSPDFIFTGPKYGDELKREYDDCDLLVLPSFTENFGGVVVDALAHGKPVIASRRTPWKVLEDERCGWWVDNSPESLAATLRAACGEEGLRALPEMGARGRQLVAERYSWPAVCEKLIKAYEDVSRLKVLHVVARMGQAAGGPPRSAQGLVAELCKRGVDAWIYSFDKTKPWLEGVRKFNQTISNQTIRQFNLVHIHGIWDWRLHRVAAMCRKAGIRYVIAPRGMLEPWALWRKWLKKRIGRWLYQDRDLRCAAALHATAESEAEQFRRLGFKNKIIVSPNGVNVPEEKLKGGKVERFQGGKVEKFQSGKVERFQSGKVERLKGFKVERFQSGKGERLKGFKVERLKGFKVERFQGGKVEKLEGCGGVERRVLFVSRMHPKKGVLELVESWARLRREVMVKGEGEQRWVCELVYTVNGPEERAYEQKVKERILALAMTYGEMAHGVCSVKSGQESASPFPAGQFPDFIFTGALDDEKKWEAYARADLFVLPTYSENFGIVVAEALWAGVPVITTKGAPWSELEERKCGWWIDLPEAEVKVKGEGEQWNALDSALREAMSLLVISDRKLETIDKHQSSPSPFTFTSLKEMGRRGHELVAERYTWAAVCDRMIEGYESLEVRV